MKSADESAENAAVPDLAKYKVRGRIRGWPRNILQSMKVFQQILRKRILLVKVIFRLMLLLEVYALHLSRDLAYIVGVAPINSTLCNTFHQVITSMLPTRIRGMLKNSRWILNKYITQLILAKSINIQILTNARETLLPALLLSNFSEFLSLNPRWPSRGPPQSSIRKEKGDLISLKQLHLHKAYIVRVVLINSTLCNTFHQIMTPMLPTRIRGMLENSL
jgi:hypothetical protein